MKTLSMDRVVKRPEAQHALLQQAKESSASHKPGPERIRIRIEGKPDARVQVRAGINQATIDRYADEMRLLRDQGKIPAEEFDPVVLFRGDDGELLADGFHRYAAATKAGEPELRAEVYRGGLSEALEYALGKANRKHGLQLTQEDRRNGVLKALEQWGETRSDPVIAELVGVHQSTVWRIRQQWQREKTGSNALHSTQEQTGLPGLAPVEQPVKKMARDGTMRPAQRPAALAPRSDTEEPQTNPVFRPGDGVLVGHNTGTDYRLRGRSGVVIAPNPHSVSRRTYHVRVYSPTGKHYADALLGDGEIKPNPSAKDRARALRTLQSQGIDKKWREVISKALTEADAAQAAKPRAVRLAEAQQALVGRGLIPPPAPTPGGGDAAPAGEQMPPRDDFETLRARAVGDLVAWSRAHAALGDFVLSHLLLEHVLALPKSHLPPAHQKAVRRMLSLDPAVVLLHPWEESALWFALHRNEADWSPLQEGGADDGQVLKAIRAALGVRGKQGGKYVCIEWKGGNAPEIRLTRTDSEESAWVLSGQDLITATRTLLKIPSRKP